MRIHDKHDVFRSFEYRPPRLHRRFSIWLRFESSAQTSLVPAVCTDISENGMGAELEVPFTVGGRATLILPTSSRSQPFVVPARVVAQQGQRLGLVFVPATAEHVREIAAAIRAVAEENNLRSTEDRSPGQAPEREAV